MRLLADELTPEIRDATSQVLAALNRGDAATALAMTESLATALPRSSLPPHLIGLISSRLTEPGKALRAFSLAHDLAPETREHAEALGIVHAHLGHVVDALYFGKLATAATEEYGIADLLPDWLGGFAETFFAMKDRPLLAEAEAHEALGAFEPAEQLYRKAAEVDPDSSAAWRGLARMGLALGRPLDAIEAGGRLVEQKDPSPADRSLYAEALGEAGRYDEAIGAHRRASAMSGDDPAVAFSLIRTLARRPAPDDAALASAAAGFHSRFAAGSIPHPARPSSGELAGRRLKLAVVSGRWRPGGGIDLIIPVLERLAADKVELYVYAADTGGAALAKALRGRADHWHEIGDLDDETVSLVLRNDRPDVLIDLDGPARCTRPTLFLAGAASLTLSLYGLAGAAAALGFDAVLAGPNAAASDGTVLRVPGGVVALPIDLIRLDSARRQRWGPTVFGTLAPWCSIAGEVAEAWARILTDLPGSTLVLELGSLGGLRAAAQALDRFGALLPAGRFFVREIPQLEYLSSIDIALEAPGNPFPDAAVAATGLGVPVLSVRGGHPRGSLLTDWQDRIGMGALAAPDLASFVEIAKSHGETQERRKLAETLSAAIAKEREHGATRTAGLLIDTLARALVE
jgi:tetratricopeptide (TPR) repeat protein